MKRLGIFCFYDKDGIVDDYVIHLLSEAKDHLEQLLIVCNGYVDSDGYKRLTQVANEVLQRENKGFDISAYKKGIQHFGWSKICEYDEVILFNDTIFGPIYPFSEMFDEMNKREELDFWGITKNHGRSDPIARTSYSEHIQSYWTVIRNRMLKNKFFQEYWSNLRPIITYEDAVFGHEVIFTKHFEKLEFCWDVYVDTTDFQELIDYPLFFLPLEVIRDKRCPVVKRKIFVLDYSLTIFNSLGNQIRDMVHFIDTETQYDIDLIFGNILRTGHMADIKNNLHLNYILPERLKLDVNGSGNKRIALVIHIHHEDQIENCMKYIKSMPSGTDVLITTNSIEKRDEILLIGERFDGYPIQVYLVSKHGEYIEAMFLEIGLSIKKYDLICYIHDQRCKSVSPGLIGKGFADKCLEGMLRSQEYVENILTTFLVNPRLGLLFPPPSNHSIYFKTLGDEWDGNFDGTVKLLNRLGLKVLIDEKKEPIAPLGSMFWFRVKALSPLFDEKWSDMELLEDLSRGDETLGSVISRTCPYVAQSKGYYSAWVLPESLAEVELTNLSYSVQLINKQWQRIQEFRRVRDVERGIKKVRKYFIKRFFSREYWRQKFQNK